MIWRIFDDMLDAMRFDALSQHADGEALEDIAAEAAASSADLSSIAADASAAQAGSSSAAPAPPPSPPRQLKLSDLSVKQLRVLIKALGGEQELEGIVITEKPELMRIAISVLAASPLPLIDDVTSAFRSLQPLGRRLPSTLTQDRSASIVRRAARGCCWRSWTGRPRPPRPKAPLMASTPAASIQIILLRH